MIRKLWSVIKIDQVGDSESHYSHSQGDDSRLWRWIFRNVKTYNNAAFSVLKRRDIKSVIGFTIERNNVKRMIVRNPRAIGMNIIV